MGEINFLTEKDIPYFEKLEKEGKAVIIRIDPEKLVNLDLSELDERESATVEDIQVWIKDHKAELVEAAEKAEEVIRENEAMEKEIGERLVQALSDKELSEEKAAVIMEAISSRLGDEEILALLRDEFTPEMIERILNFV